MSTASKVLMYDIDNIIPEYVLWYLSKFKIEVSEGEVLRHDSESNIDYCQGIFKFKGNELSIGKQILRQGTEQEELCWRILDSYTTEEKSNGVTVEKFGQGVIIRKNKIAFRLIYDISTETYASWRIVFKEIDCGVVFEFSSAITEIMGELRITYDDSTGNITIRLLFGEEINKIVPDKKKKNDTTIKF